MLHLILNEAFVIVRIACAALSRSVAQHSASFSLIKVSELKDLMMIFLFCSEALTPDSCNRLMLLLSLLFFSSLIIKYLHMITAGSCSPRVLVCSEAQQVTQHVAIQVLAQCFRVLCQYVLFNFRGQTGLSL